MSTLESIESTSEQEHYEEEHLAEFEPEDVHAIPWKLWAFLTIPFLEVLAQAIFTSDIFRAVMVSPAFVLVSLIAGFDLISQSRVRSSAHPISLRYAFTVCLWLGGVGLFAIALAIGWNNELFYIAADMFHWYIEFVAVAFLGVWACASYSSLLIGRTFAKAFFFMSLVGIGVVVLGATGFPVAGGKAVEGIFRFRLDLGRGYPLIPLLISLAIFLYAPRSQGRVSLSSIITIGLLMACLLFTLKRTQWLLFPVFFVCMLMPKRLISLLPFFAMIGLALMWAFHIVSPTTLPHLIDDAKQMLTYNDNWTIDDTLDNRQAQVDATLKEAAKHWWGKGFGAEVLIPTPNGKTVDRLHYVHSLYAYYALQFGVFGCFAAVGVCVVLMLALFLSLDTNAEVQWMVRAAVFTILAFASSGLMMVSIHTTFAGLVLSLAIIGLARCSHPHPADGAHEYDDEDDADWEAA